VPGIPGMARKVTRGGLVGAVAAAGPGALTVPGGPRRGDHHWSPAVVLVQGLPAIGRRVDHTLAVFLALGLLLSSTLANNLRSA